MNDRYLFRAKRIVNGEWVEGFLLKKHGLFFIYSIINSDTCRQSNYDIDPSTICQCTGMKDIYEHDIFKCDGETYEIVFDQEDLVWWADGYGHQYIQLGEFKQEEIKVVGNIFDNPEQLEQEV